MKNIKYEREKVLKYAKRWAYDRNPQFYNFDNVGGDCTSFVSQCILAGSNVMKLYIASHTFDSYNKKISEYGLRKIRFIHINGVRNW